MLSIGVVAGTVLTLIFNAFLYGRTMLLFEHTFKADFMATLLIICASLLVYAVMNLSMFPVLFKIGYAKGKALGYYIPCIVACVALGVIYILRHLYEPFSVWLLSVMGYVLANTTATAFIILGAAVLIFAASYALSQKVYAKREF
jgi:hypothetical protein